MVFIVGDMAGKSIVVLYMCCVVCFCVVWTLQWGGRGGSVETDLESVDTVFLSTSYVKLLVTSKRLWLGGD